MIFLALIAFLFGLCLIISLHELGHFIFAKKANILCYDYSIGMGPLLYGKKKGETLYGIRAIPLGGYVSMAGEQMIDEILKVDMEIGLNLEDGKVKEIIFDNAKEASVKGKVVNRDLYGENGELFIELSANGLLSRFEVLNDACFIDIKRQMQIAPYNRCFESKTLWQRFITLFAGPGMNFVLAFFLFLIVAFIVGVPKKGNVVGAVQKYVTIDNVNYNLSGYDLGLKKGNVIIEIENKTITKWSEIGDALLNPICEGKETVELVYYENSNSTTPITVQVRPTIYLGNLGVCGNLSDTGNAQVFVYTSKAEKAGLKNKDIITKIGTVDISSWSELVKYCLDEKNDGIIVDVKVLRDGKEEVVSVDMLDRNTIKNINGLEVIDSKIGISPIHKFSFFGSFAEAGKDIGSSLGNVGNTLKALFSSSEVGVSDLSGPVGIYGLIKNSLLGGFANYVYFLGFLSVNIGFLNLLPIPALDGGRIAFLGYELVTKKKVNRKVETILNNVVFFALIALFIFVTFSDLRRLFHF